MKDEKGNHWSASSGSYESWVAARQKRASEEDTDMKLAVVFFMTLLIFILSGCSCAPGSDAISQTVCTDDRRND